MKNNFVIILKPRLPFTLKENIVKPYACQVLSYEKIVFSYKWTSARIAENVFGMLANWTQVLLSRILKEQEMVENVAVTSCMLREYLSEKILL